MSLEVAHHLTSGLKAITTDMAYIACDEAFNLSKGKPLESCFNYLSNIDYLLDLKLKASTVQEFTSSDHLETMLQIRAAYLFKQTVSDMQASDLTNNQKLNEEFALEILQTTRAHLILCMFVMSRD